VFLLAYVSWASAELQRFASVYQRQVLESANNTFLNIAQCTHVILDEFASVCCHPIPWHVPSFHNLNR